MGLLHFYKVSIMTYFNQRAKFEAIRSRAFGSISGSYATVGTATTNPARLIVIQNLTDAPMMFSFDGGTTDNLALAAGSGAVLDFTSDSVSESPMQLPANTQISVKQISAPTSGSVYVSIIYASNQ